MSDRLNTSVLATCERRLLGAIVRRLPTWVLPDQLTAVGLLGAVATGAGFLLCHWSAWFLALVVAGLATNWFGDSLDGSLARHRSIERPRYGFLLDHSSDLIAMSLIVVGLGASPFFTMPSALFVLSLYLLMSSYTYLRVATEGVHRLSYGGMGATEFRILVAVWALIAHWAGPGLIEARILRFAWIDVSVGALSAVAFTLFVLMVRRDLAQMDAEEEREVGASATVHRLPSARRREAAEPEALPSPSTAEPAPQLQGASLR